MLLLLICCGSPTKDVKSEEIVFLVEENAVHEDLEETKKDLSCIRVFLEDKKEAERLNVKQMPLSFYEEKDCVHLIKEEK